MLYCDNLRVHETAEAEALLKELGIKQQMCLKYAPDTNPIEACFSQVKLRFNRERCNALSKEEPFDRVAGIKRAFKAITPKLVASCYKRSLSILKYHFN